MVRRRRRPFVQVRRGGRAVGAAQCQRWEGVLLVVVLITVLALCIEDECGGLFEKLVAGSIIFNGGSQQIVDIGGESEGVVGVSLGRPRILYQLTIYVVDAIVSATIIPKCFMKRKG